MSTMTLNRRFTLSTHGVIELVLGLVTLVSPVLLHFADAGVIVAVVLGSLLVGMGVTVGGEQRSAPGWHQLLDMVSVIATALAALGLALAGEVSASLFFVALTVLRSGLSVTTRYVVSA
jgi:hypothetical protein